MLRFLQAQNSKIVLDFDSEPEKVSGNESRTHITHFGLSLGLNHHVPCYSFYRLTLQGEATQGCSPESKGHLWAKLKITLGSEIGL